MKCIEDEIPFEIPEGWAWSRLLSLTIKIGAGSTPSGGAAVYSTFGIKFIRSQNIYDDGLVLDDVAYISEEINQKKKGSIVKPNDILLNITGGSIGRCSLVPDDFDIANVNQHVIIIRLVDSRLQKYLHSVITSPYIQEQILSRQAGSGRGGLSAETLSTFLIPLPPIDEQFSIHAKLAECISYISTISTSQLSIIDICTIVKSKILDSAIRGKLVPQNSDDEPASVLLERIRAEKKQLIKQGKIKPDKKESIIFRGEDNSYYLPENAISLKMPFEIPDSWSWSTLKELCNYGYCEKISAENIPQNSWVLDLEDIEKDTGKVIQHITNKDRSVSSTKHVFHKNMILYSKLRPYLNKVVLADNDGFCTSEILPLAFNKVIYPRYAQIFLMSPFFVNYASNCSYGMKMPRLGTQDGQNAFFSIPPYNEQIKIADKTNQLFSQLELIKTNIN